MEAPGAEPARDRIAHLAGTQNGNPWQTRGLSRSDRRAFTEQVDVGGARDRATVCAEERHGIASIAGTGLLVGGPRV